MICGLQLPTPACHLYTNVPDSHFVDDRIIDRLTGLNEFRCLIGQQPVFCMLYYLCHITNAPTGLLIIHGFTSPKLNSASVIFER